MRIAIHHRPGSFSDRWIQYCEEKGIDYIIVNAYSTDIIDQVSGCDAFMWHYHQYDYRDMLFARQLIYSLEAKGIRCYPNFQTAWHFDDKVGQKYLLESIGAPLVPSYVFYTKEDAFTWIAKTTFPKVFKLRGGSGAANVKLAHTASEARSFVRIAFGRGFSQFDRFAYFKERWRKWREGKDSIISVLKGLGRLLITTEYAKMHGVEKGYVYFQDFIPDNYFDIRVVVIGNKAMGEKRYVRKGDFRASGSGDFEYVPLSEDVLKIAFDTAKRLKMQSVAFDFIFHNKRPLIVEMSYGFGTHGISHSGGYYTDDFKWHDSPDLNFGNWMVDNLINSGDV